MVVISFVRLRNNDFPRCFVRGWQIRNSTGRYAEEQIKQQLERKSVCIRLCCCAPQIQRPSCVRLPTARLLSSSAQRSQKEAYEFYRRRNKSTNLSRFWSLIFGENSVPKRPAVTAEQKNVTTAWYAVAIAIGALGASYAAVPLYKVFCQTTGFGGTTQRVNIVADGSDGTTTSTLENALKQLASSLLPAGTAAKVHTWTDADALERLRMLKPVRNSELITVRFDTTVNDVLPWSFEPIQMDVQVVPGETALSFFRVTNRSPDKAITGVATYNVYPPKVGLYFQKIQCFCFEEQRLLPGETVDMPVFFFIDPEIIDDPQVAYVRNVTLAYTFFQTDVDNDEDDQED